MQSSRSTTHLQGRTSIILQEVRPCRILQAAVVLYHVAAGSHEDLDRSEHEREAACANDFTGRSRTEHSQSTSRDVSHGLKCGRTVDVGVSNERPHPKERRAERGRSHECKHFNMPEHPLPPPFLLTPTAPSCPTTGSISVPLVDPNRGSSSLDKGARTGVSVPAGLVPPCSACKPVQGSGQLMNTQIGSVLVTSGLTAAQAEEIFLLSHEVQTLHGKLALDFIELSHSEANFRMGAQATSHENTVEEHPDHSSGKRGEATQRSGEATWLHINSLLFCHTLDYQRYMVQLINHSQEAIQALHERIWEVVRQVMESAGKSTADGLGVALHLVDMLPTIPLQLTFNTVTAGPLGHTPKALTYASQRSIDCGAMTVLGEELIREPLSAKDEVMQAIWCVTATDTGSTRMATTGGAGDYNVDHPGTSLSPALCASTSMDWHTTGYGTKHSPTYSPNCSPFQTHRSPGSRQRSNSSDSNVPSFDSSIPTESVSDTKSSLGDSDGQEQSRPEFP